MKTTRVLILGGGFGGLYAALEFEKRRDPSLEVTLVSHDNFFLFTPMLHEVAASDLDLTHIVYPGDHVLPELGETLGRYAGRKLAGRGVELRSNTKVQAVTPLEVELSDGERLRSFTLVWTAGTSPHPVLDLVDLPKERGRIKVDACMAVEGKPGVWALGDCAMIPDALQEGQFCPPTAQHASRQGTVLARNIAAAIEGRPLKAFSFKTLGLLASIGQRTGVARILGVNFSGFIAWWLWRGIYLSKLPRFEKKVRVALDWTLDLFFSKDFVQYLHPRATAVGGEHPLSSGQGASADRPPPIAVPSPAGPPL